MSPWIAIVIILVLCAFVVVIVQRGENIDANTPPAPLPPTADDAHVLAVTQDADRLAPIPHLPQKPDVRPGMYTFGFIWRWDGREWHLETPPDAEPITAIHGVGRALYATAWNELWRRGPDGWQMLRMPVRLFALHGWSEDDFMCAGIKSVFRMSAEGVEPMASLPQSVSALWGPSADAVWAVGWSGMLVRLRDGRWIDEGSGVESRLTDIHGQNGELIAVGEDAVALHSTGDGRWTREAIPEREQYPHSLASVWGDGRGAWYAVTSGGDILARRDGVWRVEHSTGRQLTSVTGRGPADVFAIGLQGHVWRSTGDGHWRDEGGARSLSLHALHRHGDDIYVGGDWFFEVR